MSGTPFWGGDPSATDDEKNDWDRCQLGDDLLPGIVEDVAIDDNGREVDEQKAKGNNGVSLKDNGVGAAKVTITLRLWTPEHHAAWAEIRRRIDPKNPGGLRTPLPITHPRAMEEGIKGVYVRRIDAQQPNPVSGRTVVIECVEWFPQPKPAKSSQKPKAAGDGPSRLGLPGEALPLNGREGINPLDFGPEPEPDKDPVRKAEQDKARRELKSELNRIQRNQRIGDGTASEQDLREAEAEGVDVNQLVLEARRARNG